MVDVVRTSTIENVVPEQGRTGPLVFVTVRHCIQVNGEPGDDGSVRLWSRDHEGLLTMDAVATLR